MTYQSFFNILFTYCIHLFLQLWASISSLQGFTPGTGVHEWALRIDKSDRGHVFVGVVTADASMESYIGSDR